VLPAGAHSDVRPLLQRGAQDGGGEGGVRYAGERRVCSLLRLLRTGAQGPDSSKTATTAAALLLLLLLLLLPPLRAAWRPGST